MSADDAQTLEADFEKTPEESRERSFMLIIVLLIVSVAVHIGLMLSVSDYSFTPTVEKVHTDRKLTKDLPQMQMRKYEGDPLAEIIRDVPRPAPAPDEERQVDRVERLSGDVTGSVAPEMPESPASIMAPAQPDVAPRAVEAAEWQRTLRRAPSRRPNGSRARTSSRCRSRRCRMSAKRCRAS